MAVPASRRRPSPAEYLDQAVGAAWLLAGLASSLPARWRDNRSRWLLELGWEVMREAGMAEAVWVTCAAESRARLAHLQAAYGACAVAQTALTLIARERPVRPRYLRGQDGEPVRDGHGRPVKEADVPCVSEGRLTEASVALDREAGLLHGVIERERRRLREYGG